MRNAFIIIFIVLVSGCVNEARIIDGDTIEYNKQTIRLLGLNAPESGQPFYIESKEALRSLIEEKRLRLESDYITEDHYGRQLRYIHTDVFINREMIRLGYAKHFTLNEDLKYDFSEDQLEAMNNRLGMWSVDTFCIEIQDINPKEDFITFRNICPFEVDLDDWYVRDKTGHRYYFKTSISDKLVLYSLSGDDSDVLYWNSEYPIWNNNGDIAQLYDREENLAFEFSY